MVYVVVLILGQLVSGGADKECGLRCLYIALVSCGADTVSLGALRDSLGPTPDEGYSLAQLEATARAEGVHTRLTKTSLERLRQRYPPYACIAHVQPGHYYCVTDFGDKTVTVMSDAYRRVIPLGEFKKIWTGNVLLISNKPIVSDEWLTFLQAVKYSLLVGVIMLALWGGWRAIARWRNNGFASYSLFFILCVLIDCSGCGGSGRPQANGGSAENARETPDAPQITLSKSSVELGIIPYSEKWYTHNISLTNAGTKPLLVKQIEVSCSCLQVTPVPSNIKAGEKIALEIRVSPVAAENGKQAAQFIIHSNDPNVPEFPVKVAWDIERVVKFDPFAIHLGTIEPGESAPYRLHIADGLEESLKRLESEFKMVGRAGLKTSFALNIENKIVEGTVTAPEEEGDYVATAMLCGSGLDDGESPILATVAVKVQRKIGASPSKIALVVSENAKDATRDFSIRVATTQGDLKNRLQLITVEKQEGVRAAISSVEILSDDLAVLKLSISMLPFDGDNSGGQFVLSGGEGEFNWSQRIPVYATAISK